MTLEQAEIQQLRARPWEVKRAMRNVGGSERLIRLGAGMGVLAAATGLERSWLRNVAGLLGLGGVVTAVIGYCPVSQTIGRDTYHRRIPPKYSSGG